MPTLILTPRFTEDSQALWRAAGARGWGVERLTSWRVPNELLSIADPVFYLEALFGPSIAEQFGYSMIEPPNDWLPKLPEEYRKRSVDLVTMDVARRIVDYSIYLRRGEPQRENGFTDSTDEVREMKTFVDAVLSDSRIDFPARPFLMLA